jgi:transglutaminase/protease-like cytokinesis protein 3
MISYENNGEIYFEPIKLNTIKKTAVSRKAIKKRLKKLKITKMTYWKTACRRISTWIAKNYSYDKKQVWEYDLQKIWKKKKTVCHGYASIFYAMAKECGYDVHYVETNSHAFNYIVKNGKKYFYDVTSARVDYTDTVKTKKKGFTVSIKKNKVEVDDSYFAMKKFNLSKYIIYDYSY